MKSNKITFEKYNQVKERRLYDLEKDRALKERIKKASKSIRKKYLAFKLGKAEEEETINRFLKPVIDPLKELKSLNVPLVENDSKIFFPTAVLKPKEEEEEEEKEELIEDTYEGTRNDCSEQYPPLARSYLQGLYNRSNDYDETYGVRFSNEMNKLYIGNTVLHIGSNAGISIGNKMYGGKRGLYELLFMKNPKDYDEQDLADYKEILEASSAHKRNYDSSNQFNGTRSSKYKHIVKPLFKSRSSKLSRKSIQSHSGSGISSIVYNEKPIEYIYWDDMNELVDRLKLLNASKAVGNTDSHDNEILAIINELREAGIID